MNHDQLKQLRSYCRDDIAFEQLVQFLTTNRLLQDDQSVNASQAVEKETLMRVVSRIRTSLELHDIFRATTDEVRYLLHADRVVIYRFNPDWSGEFVAESVADQWLSLLIAQQKTPALNANISDCHRIQALHANTVEDTWLMETQGGRYHDRQTLVVNDVSQAGFSDCYLNLLKRFQARAYAIVPIFQHDRLWGLLATYQNAAPRQWHDSEVTLLIQIANQLGIALQQAEYIDHMRSQSRQLARAAERERSIVQLMGKLGQSIISQIRQPFDINTTLQATIDEIRQFLGADRVVIYQLYPDWSGAFICESAADNTPPIVPEQHRDILHNLRQCRVSRLQSTDVNLGHWQDNLPRSFVMNDIHQAELTDCYTELLQQYGVRAYAIAPVYCNETLWGILAAYQCSAPRQWDASEVSLLTQVATQLGAALQMAASIRETQLQEEWRQAIVNITNSIRQLLDIDSILSTATKELRHVLQVDRAAVYRFNPDWSGEFVAESVAEGWVKLVGADVQKVWEDTYLQETKGGRYRRNETFSVSDIYTAGHLPCHIELLEQFQARAYAIAAIPIGDRLWGLLVAYQNAAPRQWQDTEATLLAQVGIQLGIALQQAELLANLQAEVHERQQAEQTVRNLNGELQQSVLELTNVNRELEAFSYSVSHDLRAPLRSIDGFSQALLEDCFDRLDETGKDYLKRIRAATQRMGQLIDELLSLSRVMRSEMQYDVVDLSATARAIASELQQSAPDRQVYFDIQEGLIAQGDPRLVRVMLNNLFDNAWKFTSKQPVAEIKFSRESSMIGSIIYSVQDNGAGFDMAYANKLFGAFQRLHSMTEFPGTGIGLATVQRIVHRHGGQVWAKSAVGQGATFYFTLQGSSA